MDSESFAILIRNTAKNLYRYISNKKPTTGTNQILKILFRDPNLCNVFDSKSTVKLQDKWLI